MAIENEEYCCIFGELSGGGGAEVPALAIPRGSARKHFHTDAPMGRRCESAFALLSHKKVTKRLWPAASYGKIGVVGYGVVKEACPGALQEPPGQAIITVKIGNKMY